MRFQLFVLLRTMKLLVLSCLFAVTTAAPAKLSPNPIDFRAVPLSIGTRPAITHYFETIPENAQLLNVAHAVPIHSEYKFAAPITNTRQFINRIPLDTNFQSGISEDHYVSGTVNAASQSIRNDHAKDYYLSVVNPTAHTTAFVQSDAQPYRIEQTNVGSAAEIISPSLITTNYHATPMVVKHTEVQVPIQKEVKYGMENFEAGTETHIFKPSIYADAIAPPAQVLFQNAAQQPQISLKGSSSASFNAAPTAVVGTTAHVGAAALVQSAPAFGIETANVRTAANIVSSAPVAAIDINTHPGTFVRTSPVNIETQEHAVFHASPAVFKHAEVQVPVQKEVQYGVENYEAGTKTQIFKPSISANAIAPPAYQPQITLKESSSASFNAAPTAVVDPSTHVGVAALVQPAPAFGIEPANVRAAANIVSSAPVAAVDVNIHPETYVKTSPVNIQTQKHAVFHASPAVFNHAEVQVPVQKEVQYGVENYEAGTKTHIFKPSISANAIAPPAYQPQITLKESSSASFNAAPTAVVDPSTHVGVAALVQPAPAFGIETANVRAAANIVSSAPVAVVDVNIHPETFVKTSPVNIQTQKHAVFHASPAVFNHAQVQVPVQKEVQYGVENYEAGTKTHIFKPSISANAIAPPAYQPQITLKESSSASFNAAPTAVVDPSTHVGVAALVQPAPAFGIETANVRKAANIVSSAPVAAVDVNIHPETFVKISPVNIQTQKHAVFHASPAVFKHAEVQVPVQKEVQYGVENYEAGTKTHIFKPSISANAIAPPAYQPQITLKESSSASFNAAPTAVVDPSTHVGVAALVQPAPAFGIETANVRKAANIVSSAPVAAVDVNIHPETFVKTSPVNIQTQKHAVFHASPAVFNHAQVQVPVQKEVQYGVENYEAGTKTHIFKPSISANAIAPPAYQPQITLKESSSASFNAAPTAVVDPSTHVGVAALVQPAPAFGIETANVRAAANIVSSAPVAVVDVNIHPETFVKTSPVNIQTQKHAVFHASPAVFKHAEVQVPVQKEVQYGVENYEAGTKTHIVKPSISANAIAPPAYQPQITLKESSSASFNAAPTAVVDPSTHVGVAALVQPAPAFGIETANVRTAANIVSSAPVAAVDVNIHPETFVKTSPVNIQTQKHAVFHASPAVFKHAEVQVPVQKEVQYGVENYEAGTKTHIFKPSISANAIAPPAYQPQITLKESSSASFNAAPTAVVDPSTHVGVAALVQPAPAFGIETANVRTAANIVSSAPVAAVDVNIHPETFVKISPVNIQTQKHAVFHASPAVFKHAEVQVPVQKEVQYGVENYEAGTKTHIFKPSISADAIAPPAYQPQITLKETSSASFNAAPTAAVDPSTHSGVSNIHGQDYTFFHASPAILKSTNIQIPVHKEVQYGVENYDSGTGTHILKPSIAAANFVSPAQASFQSVAYQPLLKKAESFGVAPAAVVNANTYAATLNHGTPNVQVEINPMVKTIHGTGTDSLLSTQSGIIYGIENNVSPYTEVQQLAIAPRVFQGAHAQYFDPLNSPEHGFSIYNSNPSGQNVVVQHQFIPGFPNSKHSIHPIH